MGYSAYLIVVILIILVGYFVYEYYTVRSDVDTAMQTAPAENVPPEMYGYSTPYNLPKIKINLDKPAIGSDTTCAVPTLTDLPCRDFCNNDNAYELIVEKDGDALANTVLKAGRYCTLTEPVPCHKRWGTLVWGLDEWTCVARHPDLVGGKSANVANFLFYDSDTLLSKNTFTIRGEPATIDQVADQIDPLTRTDLGVQCNQTIDDIKMVRLGNSFKCVKDPCQTIPGTDSHWNGGYCECGVNQTNIVPGDKMTPCIGSNYQSIGYDEATTTERQLIECSTWDSPYTNTPKQPCPNFLQQVSKFGIKAFAHATGSLYLDVNSTGSIKK